MRLNMIATMVAAALAGTSTLATSAQTTPGTAQTTPGAQGKGKVVDAPPPNYADSMARLQEAAQRLREAIQLMAQHKAGDQRNLAIRQSHQALFDVQQAMIQLPPELYTDASKQGQPNYTLAMERLQQASGKLVEAIQAMAKQPEGPGRNAAAQQALEAIVETHVAMVALPPRMTAQSTGAAAAHADVRDGSDKGTAGKQAARTGTSVPKTFAEIDRDNDGFISMIEAASDSNAKQLFKQLDKNNDGKLSRSEFEAGHAPAAGGSPGQAGTTKR